MCRNLLHKLLFEVFLIAKGVTWKGVTQIWRERQRERGFDQKKSSFALISDAVRGVVVFGQCFCSSLKLGQASKQQHFKFPPLYLRRFSCSKGATESLWPLEGDAERSLSPPTERRSPRFHGSTPSLASFFWHILIVLAPPSSHRDCNLKMAFNVWVSLSLLGKGATQHVRWCLDHYRRERNTKRGQTSMSPTLNHSLCLKIFSGNKYPPPKNIDIFKGLVQNIMFRREAVYSWASVQCSWFPSHLKF